MKKLLSVVSIIIFSMSCMVCYASDLKENLKDNFEENTCKEKTNNFDGFVIYLNEKRNEETEESEVSFNEEWLVKKPSNKKYYVRIIRKAENGSQDFDLVKEKLISIEEDDVNEAINFNDDPIDENKMH